jgi:hypothetical protein
MIPEIDWKAEMAALDASLPERLERLARRAELEDLRPRVPHDAGRGRGRPSIEALDEMRHHRGIEE